MTLLEQIRAKARYANKCIVLAEGTEERTLKAADFIMGEGLARIVLLGNEKEIHELANKWALHNIDKARIIDPVNNEKKEFYAQMLCEIRKKKGMQMDEAMRLVEDPLYLACLLIKNGEADGEVAGARNATGDVLRPAFQIVKTQPGVSVVSGAYIMILKDKHYGENGMMVFADCAATPCPTAAELGQIAVVSAQTAKNIGGFEEPRVAILSFSTKGSAKHELVDKVIEATRVAHELDPNVRLDGELQADAAIVPKVAVTKAPQSDIAGKANVLVFPDLQSGNICYKLVQRLAGAEAIGPIMQGMAAPINDLSRGCSVEDVINVVCITAFQAAAMKR
ncbi:MAG: phosphate acetyltransferase [Bacteroidales bacterium]|nr:phosphate acetyltransferase [Bacteroidales bacterium]